MSDIEKILVFGATGNTGLTILERGVKEGKDDIIDVKCHYGQKTDPSH